MWKASTKVGFGIKGKFVLAYYCEKAGNTGEKKNYKMNVCKKDQCKLCTEGKDGVAYKYNKCYNKLALDEHNIYRLDHSSPKFAEYHVEAAKAAQI